MNELLQKYWEGNTSLTEEQQLRDYFNSNDIAPEHKMYSAMFKTFEDDAVEEDIEFDAFAKAIPAHSTSIETGFSNWKGLAIAAGFSFLIAVGAGFYSYNQKADLGTYESPEEAYAATMDALKLVSEKFNKGKSKLAPVKHVNQKTEPIIQLVK